MFELKNKNIQILIYNLFALYVLQILRYVIPLMVLPFVSPIIGVKHFGDIAIANAICLIFQAIVDYGFNYIGAREIARNRDDIDCVSHIFSAIIWAKIFLFICMLPLLIIIVNIIPSFFEIRTVIYISISVVFFSILFPEWLFQGLEEMKYITIINSISRILFVVCVFSFIREKNDYIYYPLFNSISFLLAGIVSMYIVICKKKVLLYRPKYCKLLALLKRGFDIFINQICFCLYQYVPNLLLGTIRNTQSAGIFDSATRLIYAGEHTLDVITRTFYPYLSRKIDKHVYYERFSMFFAFLLSIILFVGAPFFFSVFYSENFNEGIKVMRILSISIFFSNMNSIYGINYLLLKGKERLVRNVTLLCSLVGLITLIPAIYWWGYIGVAYTLLGIKIILGLFFCFLSKKMN